MNLKQFMKFFMDSNSNADYLYVRSEGKDVLLEFEGAKGNKSSSNNGLYVSKQSLMRSEEAENLNVVYAGITDDGNLFINVE